MTVTSSAAPRATVLIRIMGPFQLRQLPYYGGWGFAHESRTDFSMVMGSLFLFLVGPGPLSLDERRTTRR
jgi:putative oxidoreductase